jgi:hypothetical protein
MNSEMKRQIAPVFLSSSRLEACIGTRIGAFEIAAIAN